MSIASRILPAAFLFATSGGATFGSAACAAEAARPWSLAVIGGLTAVQSQSDQPFAGISLRRALGNAYVRGGLTWVGSGNARGLAIPADTWLGTIGAGTSMGAVSLDGYVNFGQRKFNDASFRRPDGTRVLLDRSGSTFGIGGTATWDIAVGKDWFVSPFAALDYNSVDFAVATRVGNVVTGSLQDKSDGVTGTGGVGISYILPGEGGSLGLSAAFSHASNLAAVGQIGRTGANLPRFVDSGTAPDSWGEIAATTSFDISPSVAIDLSLVQTIGFAFGDTTAGSATLRFAF
ncbi:autotransporter domain-containing protein [Sandarakinorhabdus sp.]|uniref:autotransporter domain-containing protein n=1 Tax=Sandarakinorhabdus sp. TaxID=1916663 RepID=UPI00286DE147|nr:autotransporter domain-containing protein [Sandarakinorhabdus sp.]